MTRLFASATIPSNLRRRSATMVAPSKGSSEKKSLALALAARCGPGGPLSKRDASSLLVHNGPPRKRDNTSSVSGHLFKKKENGYKTVITRRKRRRGEEEIRDWRDGLPSEILRFVAERVDFFQDLVGGFSSVCRSWRSVGLDQSTRFRCRSPLLVLTIHKENPCSHEGLHYGRFFNIFNTDKSLFKLQLPAKERCEGSSNGWLFLIQKLGDDLFAIDLLEPFTKARVTLPPLPRMENPMGFIGIVRKPMLFNTAGGGSLAMVLLGRYDGYMAFCRPGDDSSWTLARVPESCLDVTYFGGRVYALGPGTRAFNMYALTSGDGNLVVEPRLVWVASAPKSRLMNQAYLVESSGELLLICRQYQSSHCKPGCLWTKRFTASRFDWEQRKWAEVSGGGIGADRAIFISGSGNYLSLSCRDRPGLRGNCIYFAGRKLPCGEHRDVGFFDMNDGTLHRFALPEEDETWSSKRIHWFVSPCTDPIHGLVA